MSGPPARPGAAGDPERTGFFVPDFSDEPGEPAPVRAPVAPPTPRRPEPELLTPAAPLPPPATHDYDSNQIYDDYRDDGYEDEGDESTRSRRWRRVRKVALVGVLLGVLAPVLAFFIGGGPIYLTFERERPSAERNP